MEILNIGCGQRPLKSNKSINYTNIDMIKHPLIIKHNLLKTPWPLQDNTYDKVIMCHVIEHFSEDKHPLLLCEIRRVLKNTGQVAISYPEFIKVAQNYINNKNGDLDFWKATIYGRGSTEYDRHKALMDTRFFKDTLMACGFNLIKVYSENKELYNTVVICNKGEPMLTIEDLQSSIYNVNNGNYS